MIFNQAVYDRNDAARQAPSSISSLNNDADLIGALARSDRGDHRVMAAIAAIATIARENAPTDQAASPPPFHPSAISTTDYADDGPPPNFEAPAFIAALTPPEHAAGAQRLGDYVIRRLRKGKATNLARKPVRLTRPHQSQSIKPVRVARARAVHSHTSHGGARKAGDDGDGEPPRRRRKHKPRRRGPRQIERDGAGPISFLRIWVAKLRRANAIMRLPPLCKPPLSGRNMINNPARFGLSVR